MREKQTVVITGAAGNLGGMLAKSMVNDNRNYCADRVCGEVIGGK